MPCYLMDQTTELIFNQDSISFGINFLIYYLSSGKDLEFVEEENKRCKLRLKDQRTIGLNGSASRFPGVLPLVRRLTRDRPSVTGFHQISLFFYLYNSHYLSFSSNSPIIPFHGSIISQINQFSFLFSFIFPFQDLKLIPEVLQKDKKSIRC